MDGALGSMDFLLYRGDLPCITAMRQLDVYIIRKLNEKTYTLRCKIHPTNLAPVFLERNILDECRTAKIHKDPSDSQLDKSPSGKDCAAGCSLRTAYRHLESSPPLDK